MPKKAKPKQRPATRKPPKDAPSLEKCDLVFEIDEAAPDVIAAVKRLRTKDRALLRAAREHVVAYAKDTLAELGTDAPKIDLRNIWKHVQLGFEMMVRRRARGGSEDGIYFSLECNCDWEDEHGLQLVIRDGRAVTKVGPFDDHVTNSSAYDDKKLVGVVYVSRGRRP